MATYWKAADKIQKSDDNKMLLKEFLTFLLDRDTPIRSKECFLVGLKNVFDPNKFWGAYYEFFRIRGAEHD